MTVGALLAGAVLALVRVNIQQVLRRVTSRGAGAAFALSDSAAVALFFALSVLSVAAGSYSPFLYFRF